MPDLLRLASCALDEVLAAATRYHHAPGDESARLAFAEVLAGRELYGHAAAVLEHALSPDARWLRAHLLLADGAHEAAFHALAAVDQDLSIDQSLIAARIEIGAGDPGAALVRLAAFSDADPRVAALFAEAQAWFEAPDAMADWVLAWPPEDRYVEVVASAVGMLRVWAGTDRERLHRCLSSLHRLMLQRWALPLLQTMLRQYADEQDQNTLRALGTIGIVLSAGVAAYSQAAEYARRELDRLASDHRQLVCSYTLFLAPMLEQVDGASLRQIQTKALRGLLADAPPVVFRHPPPQPLGGRRLRVGVLTCWYATGFFLVPLRYRDQSRFELVAFVTNVAAAPVGDGAAREAACYDTVVFVRDLDDHAIARTIRTHEIDVLLDVTGQGAGERSTVLEWRPAPIQVVWTTKLSTTGSAVVDWFLADAALVPPEHDAHFTERVWRYPEIVTPWQSTHVEIAPKPPPRLTAGMITFGTPASLVKVSDAAIRVWRAILDRVPGARFVYSAPTNAPGSFPQLCDRFLAAGFRPGQIVLVPSTRDGDLQRVLGHVDIALDPFPFGCNRTAAECLEQGVPLLTLWGDRLTGRYTATQLHALGLDDLIAETQADYIERAVALAQDSARLDQLRRDLPDRVRHSGVVDAERAMHTLAAALIGMWDEYCASGRDRADRVLSPASDLL